MYKEGTFILGYSDGKFKFIGIVGKCNRAFLISTDAYLCGNHHNTEWGIAQEYGTSIKIVDNDVKLDDFMAVIRGASLDYLYKNGDGIYNDSVILPKLKRLKGIT